MKYIRLFLLLCSISFCMAGSRCKDDPVEPTTQSNYVPPEMRPQSVYKPVATPAPAKAGVYYTVKRGDTLSLIARKFDVKVSDIVKANPQIKNPNQISSGSAILIPGAATNPDNETPPAGGTTIPTAKPGIASKAGYIRPLNGGTVCARFEEWLNDSGRRNQGINFRAEIGTPVMASRGGKVFLVSPGLVTYGRTIAIDHGNNFWTFYAHLDNTFVKPGQEVRAGQVIGTVGQSGRVGAPTLHFAIANKGKFVNPIYYIPN